jgi:hypothetical protein
MQIVTNNPLDYRQKQRPTVHVATTLYDLIETVSEQMPKDEEYLLAPAVLKILKDCRAGFLFNWSD